MRSKMKLMALMAMLSYGQSSLALVNQVLDLDSITFTEVQASMKADSIHYYLEGRDSSGNFTRVWFRNVNKADSTLQEVLLQCLKNAEKISGRSTTEIEQFFGMDFRGNDAGLTVVKLDKSGSKLPPTTGSATSTEYNIYADLIDINTSILGCYLVRRTLGS